MPNQALQRTADAAAEGLSRYVKETLGCLFPNQLAC